VSETRQALSGCLMAIIAAVVIVVIGGGIIIGGWQAGWWFSVRNAQRQGQLQNIQARNIRDGYSSQQTLREQVTSQIATVDTISTQIAATKDPGLISALRAQRAAIAATVCQDAAGVAGGPLPAQQAQWAASNCQAGTLRPGSPYYQAGTP
jgi:hypothetical protein